MWLSANRIGMVLFVLVGVVNVVPGLGALRPSGLSAYGIDVDDPATVILLRHRAILLALVGCALIAAARYTELRLAAVVAGAVSMLSFVLLAFGTSAAVPALVRVAVVDIVALVALAAAAVLTGVFTGGPASPAPPH